MRGWVIASSLRARASSREDDAGDAPCGRAPVRREHAAARTRRRPRAQPLGARRDHLARQRVRVDDRHAPRARSRAATVLLPEAIPPVSPKRCTEPACPILSTGSIRMPPRPGPVRPPRSCPGAPAQGARAAAAPRRSRGSARRRRPRPAATHFAAGPHSRGLHRRGSSSSSSTRRGASLRPTAPATPSIPTADDLDVAGFVDALDRRACRRPRPARSRALPRLRRAPRAPRRRLRLALHAPRRRPTRTACSPRSSRPRAICSARGFDGLQVARLHGLLPRPAHLAHRRLRRAARRTGPAGTGRR